MAVVIDVQVGLAAGFADGLDCPQNREVVGLCPAAGKHQFLGLAAQQSGRFPARGFQALLRQLAVLVDAGGVAGHFK